ncbi:MAG: lytic transglycosylase domain-containing protein [Holosporales bacterium]|nr:lytic transglycosylase domain-containing protein [Holosporales bacterium]
MEWKRAIQKPSDYSRVFKFFYNNPHWPLFKESVKEAERNIVFSKDIVNLLSRWFKRYPPRTSQGIMVYAQCLMEIDQKLAKLFIKQTWIFQNLAHDFSQVFRRRFDKFITPVDDAKKVKYLVKRNAIDQLVALKEIDELIDPSILSYVDTFLKKIFKTKSAGFSASSLNDVQQRLNIVQNLVSNKKMQQAAQILSMNNRDEEQFVEQFFEARRNVSYAVLRDGHPKLAYSVMSMHKLTPNSSKENYSKSEWLLGFIAYRFLGQNETAIKHFESAYDASKAAIRLSKNAFWLAEVHNTKKDVVLAIEWYKKASTHFHTFYGYVAHTRLIKLLPEHSSTDNDEFDASDVIEASPDQEMIFYGRELVQVIKTISQYPTEKEYKMYFYRQSIIEIEDPNEELLLLNVAADPDEMSMVISTASQKQHYLKSKKIYQVLDGERMGYVRRVSTDPCLMTLVHAIILRESNFNEHARSYVGAVGLMQVMPATAEYELKRIKIYTGGSVPLENPQKNITVGAFILDRLLQKYQGNIAYVAAAYNCGEGNLSKNLNNIKKIIKKLNQIDIIELIKYKETRIYVKCVLRNLAEYTKMFQPGTCYNLLRILGIRV